MSCGPWGHRESDTTERLSLSWPFTSGVLRTKKKKITSCFLDSGSSHFLVLLSPSMAHSADPQPNQTAHVATDSKPLFLPPNLPFPLIDSHAEAPP